MQVPKNLTFSENSRERKKSHQVKLLFVGGCCRAKNRTQNGSSDEQKGEVSSDNSSDEVELPGDLPGPPLYKRGRTGITDDFKKPQWPPADEVLLSFGVC